MASPLKKDTLIALYWILEAAQRGALADRASAAACLIEVRDSLLRPDTEEIVDHIRSVLERQQQAADVLAREASLLASKRPLSEQRLIEMMMGPAARRDLSANVQADLALSFGRLVEAEHGIAVEP